MPRDVDRSHLHPLMRAALHQLDEEIRRAGLPHELYEGYRPPERQRDLYAKGRTAPGPRVTRTGPWGSRHQYGLAADYVPRIDGAWRWDVDASLWRRFTDLAHALQLETLDFERPHVQLRGVETRSLARGLYPMGGDETWAACLRAACVRWGAGSPPPP